MSKWHPRVGILSDHNFDVVNGSDRRCRLGSCSNLGHQAASSNNLEIYFHDRAYRVVRVDTRSIQKSIQQRTMEGRAIYFDEGEDQVPM
jgi:hypothetical protein